MSNSQSSKGATVGVAALLGLGGAGKAVCMRGAVATGEIAAVSRVGSNLAREGMLARTASRTTLEGVEHSNALTRLGGVEGAETTLANQGDDLVRAGGSTRSANVGALERRGVIAAEGEGGAHGESLTERVVDHGPDLYDLGSNLIPEEDESDDEDDEDDVASRRSETLADETRARLAAKPLFLSVREPAGPNDPAARFTAIDGVRVVRDVWAMRTAIQSDREHGMVIVYGVRVTRDPPTLHDASGMSLASAELLAECMIAQRPCAVLVCAEGARCDGDDAWRAVANVWGTTLALSAEPRSLTAARWAERVTQARPETSRGTLGALLPVVTLRPVERATRR